MDLKQIGKGIVAAFGILAAIVGGIGSVYLIAYVIAIMLGSVYKTAQSGDLPITNATNTTLGTMETGFNTAITSVNSGTTFAASLIPVAVVMVVFGGIAVLGYVGYKKYKKGRDMGY